MASRAIRFIVLCAWFVHLDCEVYKDRPKIKTVDGDLILEPAYGKNIYFLPNGPRSSVFVGLTDILAANRSGESPGAPSGGSPGQYDASLIYGPTGVLRRLTDLENRANVSPSNLQLNVSTLWRRINRINTRLSNLEAQVQSMTRDACQSNPCRHGGTCLTLVGGYHCLCPNTWEGVDCDVDVNECRNFAGTDLGCQNGASCINKPGTYECQCKFGWFGLHCTRKLKDCSGGNYEMCGHGTCVPVPTGDGITCICDQGWTTNGTGSACLADVNECESIQGSHCSVNPRVECINTPGSFSCGHCPPGYEGNGFICSDIDECLTIPNGGCSPMVTCHNTIGSRVCGSCPPGYQGDGITCTWRGSCSIDRGGCHPSAQCIDNPALGGQGSLCVCPSNMAGDGIGLHGCFIPTSGNSTQHCESNQCVHGRCQATRLGYTCICFDGYGGGLCDAAADRCAGRPCRNGGVCRPDGAAPRGFRCECTALYTGDFCDAPVKSCGGILDHEEGSLYYPLHNSTYTHNSKCAWVIRTAPEKVINVTFSKFNLENNPECNYDFLQIHDGRSSASQFIGRFCGNEFPKGGNIISSHNYMYLWFRSDSSVAKDGFAIHWNSIPPVCGGEVDATRHGRISSPGSPGKYPPNRDCYWHLQTTLGKRIQLHFFELDIESHSNCSFDHIAVYDGEHSTDPLVSRYCNSTLPAPVHSAGSDLLIHFHSDAYGSGNGFQISYAPVEGVPGCGGFFTSERGEIVSPSYDGKYLHNLLCDYKIQTSPGSKIKLTFVSFSLERSLHCRYDYLKIYDGSTPDSRLYGKLCGNRYPTVPFISTSNSLFIKFKSDYNTASEGFKITYEAICEHRLVGDSGVIKSPGYPFNYPENRVCEYIISTAPGKAIQLNFQDFDIEDNTYYDCRYDNVEVRDGPNVNATLLGRFCGGSEHIPGTQTSTHNYMYIRFNSDMSVTGTGFYANYTTIDVECGGIFTQNTGLINHPSTIGQSYENDQSCTWMLIAPVGYVIKLTWNRFDLEKQSSCENDYLEIVEIDDNNENNVLRRYCGSTLPPALTVPTNRLKLNFHSDISVRSNGFSVLYSFLDAKSHCGGTYIKSHGYIYSPGWPNNYDRNRDCTWTITVPAGQQIMLNISQFDLEQAVRGSCDHGDYLEIKNGGSQNSPTMEKFCGSFQYRILKSFSNMIFMRFHSDMYLSGKGFKVEWDGTILGCGGTVTSASGSLSSPNYPQTYNDNAECFYKIVTSLGSRIQITFIDLDLERTQNCRDDYVEIYDGRTHNDASLGRYCQYSPALSRIMTTTNYALVKFRSDIYIGGKGFYMNYNTVCNNNLTGSYGVIESPNFPGEYPGLSNCVWTITVPKGHKINITFTHFNIYRHEYRRYTRPTEYPLSVHGVRWTVVTVTPNCDLDYLQIKQSPDLNFSEKLCGTTVPEALSSKSNIVQIKFVATATMPKTGFRLEWVRHGCGGLLQKKYGFISVDKVETSDEEMECEWIIEAPMGKSISLTFSEVYLTESNNCTTDAIEIYSGPSTNYPLLTKLCRREKATIHSNTNIMLIRYVKKSNLRGAYFSSYFNSFRSECGGSMNSLTGLIHSKNYPQNYDTNMDCSWYITVPVNHRIAIQFLDVDLYSNSDDDEDCNDFIKIYDETNQFSLITKNYSLLICPKSTITEFVSKTNTIALQFVSDGQGSAKGFKANYSVTCGAVITADSNGVITNDHFISNSNRSCTWTIVAPKPDQKITLTITHISIPKSGDIVSNKNCPSSFLRVLEGNDENGPIIDEYCGSKVPKMIVSRGSALTVQLGSYSNVTTGEFSAHYTALSNACGGTFTSLEGTIASPNYPLAYPVNTDCEWTLSTSPGNRVYVVFEKLDIARSEGCNEDYLELRENNGAGPLIDVYCGNEIPTNTTKASRIYIKFHSDNKNAGQGFLMHYGFLHGNEITGLDYGEISSPLYPFSYYGTGEYTWRIITTSSQTLSLSINRLEIHTYGTECSSYLAIYDGYDDTSRPLQELCGILYHPKELQSTRNVLFVKLNLDSSNTGSLFYIRWSSTFGAGENVDDTSRVNCGSNETQVVQAGGTAIVKSPGYPEPYDNDLNCQWVYKATEGRHLKLLLTDIQLEERPNCFADYVSVYSSETGIQWTPIQEAICKNDKKIFSTDLPFMKLIFKSDYSMTEKGFRGRVISRCGGSLTDSSGEIELTSQDKNDITDSIVKCQWKVKVRPGRVIKFKFEHFNITNKDNDCIKYVTIRNGDSKEAPFLGSGKYCGYSHENLEDIETSSNLLYVTYEETRYQTPFQSFRLHYEEKNMECGLTSKLDEDHNWEMFNTPNYPAIPMSYSECVWVFSGPVGEILRVDFERFDLKYSSDCSKEFLEIRDGQTSLSPLKTRICGREGSDSIKSSSNGLYFKYVTLLDTPNAGFRANISIDVCGGTIISGRGELSSPGYPHLVSLKYGTVCEWRITGLPGTVFKITPQTMDLPESESLCATKVTIEDLFGVNNTLKTYCNEEVEEIFSPVETSSNVVVIKYYVGKPAAWEQVSDNKGFRFTFNSSRPLCGGTISTPEGYIMTPGYPRKTTLNYCYWLISVPDKSRRVRLEIEDADLGTGAHGIGIYNDIKFRTVIQTIPSKDYNPETKVFESTGNELGLYIWLSQSSSQHRFKAKFSSNELTLCGGPLTGTHGELTSPALERSYSCNWNYRYEQSSDEYNVIPHTIYLTAKINSSTTRTQCGYSDPKLTIDAVMKEKGLIFYRDLCGNTEMQVRLPSNAMDLRAIQYKSTSLYFHLEWKLQPCGGIIQASEGSINVLDVPDNSSLECAWIIKVPPGKRIKITLEGAFQLSCADEFVQVSNSLRGIYPAVGEYCKDKMQESPLLLAFEEIYIQYHSNTKDKTSIKLMAELVNHQCGGYLNEYARVFTSPNYPKSYIENQECSWEIEAGLGNRVSLQFMDRFVIEDRVNCTKDAVIIYDWNDDTYTEMARLCGRNPPPPYNSTHNKMKVVLLTDNEINLEGFKALWVPICGGKFKAKENPQTLYSPNYPNFYMPSLDCTYEISAPGQKVTIVFLDFELEGTYPACSFDNITLSGSNSYNYAEITYCESENPPRTRYSNTAIINFKTDRYIQRRGFKLSYFIDSCGGKVNQSTIITSGEGSYDLDLNCTWLIEAPTDKVVVVKFITLHLEARACRYDYVELYDGDLIDYEKRIIKTCGFLKSDKFVFRSTGSKMLLHFVTDSSVGNDGFKAGVYFTYTESVGCGGHVNLTESLYTLNSPLIGGNSVYENYLDCLWIINAPSDKVIKLEFLSFHISPCQNVNQTAIGYSKCDCDFVEIKDGVNPDSSQMANYCGHTIPPPVTSSGNLMSVRLSTDGEINSSGFRVRLSIQPTECGQTTFMVSNTKQVIKSPGYLTGSIPRGLHCVYDLVPQNTYASIYVKINRLDLQSAENNLCNKDKLLISGRSFPRNVSLGRRYVVDHDGDQLFDNTFYFDEDVNSPLQLQFCGSHTSQDYYLSGTIVMDLTTFPETDSKPHVGFEIEAVQEYSCNRNYTGLQGRIRSTRLISSDDADEQRAEICSILITAPLNHTVSVYFMSISPDYYNSEVSLDVYDGDSTEATILMTVTDDDDWDMALFSTGRYLLLRSHQVGSDAVNFDLNYIVTNKGRGCGGMYKNVFGQVTSPLYPNTYRQANTCEWELETTVGTKLRLHFSVFDLGIACSQNYVKLVNRNGNTLFTYCDETPADFTSDDNYVKIVFTTSLNNGGTGWVARFIGGV